MSLGNWVNGLDGFSGYNGVGAFGTVGAALIPHWWVVELRELAELAELGGRRVGEASALVFNDQSRHGRNGRGVITVNRP